MGPLKVLIDGSLNTRTAYCVDPYPHGGRGLLTVSEAELLALLVRARESGFVPAVHAIGDAANQVALNAFASRRHPGTDRTCPVCPDGGLRPLWPAGHYRECPAGPCP